MSIPAFVNCRDRLSWLPQLVDWLLRAEGVGLIHLLDSGSTYPPLLEWYRRIPNDRVHVHLLGENVGPSALWLRWGQFEPWTHGGRYLLSDCDVLPDEYCPMDAALHLARVLDQFPERKKAGLGLHINDLPHEYAHCEQVQTWEARFWQRELVPGVFDAAVDTTFAVYRPGPVGWGDNDRVYPAVRTGPPYMARHRSWYLDLANLPDDERYYLLHARADQAHWTASRVVTN